MASSGASAAEPGRRKRAFWSGVDQAMTACHCLHTFCAKRRSFIGSRMRILEQLSYAEDFVRHGVFGTALRLAVGNW